jgi:hypothetical protein
MYNERSKRFKGEIMRKQYLRIVVALIGVAGLGITVKAQAVDQVEVNIPYEFTVAGKTLPAGTYTVKRLKDNDPNVLILSSFENRASVIVPSTLVEISSADQAQVSLEQVGGEYFLSKIQTADHLFTIPVSRSAILEAEAKSISQPSAPGSSGGN